MNKDQIAGTAKVLKGAVKETVGKAIGDTGLEADGKAEKIAGKARNAAGDIKAALKC